MQMYKNHMNSNISPTQIELDNIARMTQDDKKDVDLPGGFRVRWIDSR